MALVSMGISLGSAFLNLETAYLCFGLGLFRDTNQFLIGDHLGPDAAAGPCRRSERTRE